MINDPAASTAARSTGSPTMTLQPAEDGGADPQADRERRVFLVFNALGTPTQTAVQKYHNAKKVPQTCSSPPAPASGTTRRIPLDHGLSAELPRRGPDFREIHPEDQAGRQGRVFYANDDFGKDYLAGLKEIFGDKSSSIIVAEEKLRDHRALDRFPYRQLKGTGADVFCQQSLREIARRRSRRWPNWNGSRCTS